MIWSHKEVLLSTTPYRSIGLKREHEVWKHYHKPHCTIKKKTPQTENFILSEHVIK
jgi:hypothetical protein